MNHQKTKFVFLGLETISKNHFEFDINLFNQTDGLFRKNSILLFFLKNYYLR
jgi:hypothetical protein